MSKQNTDLILEFLFEDINICFHWINEFNTLFPEEPLMYELQNDIAPNFFKQLGDLYFDYFILRISKLLDPAKTGAFDNLSLYQLVELTKTNSTIISKSLKKEIDDLKTDCHTILTSRKKLKAHRDLKVAIEKKDIGITHFDEIIRIYGRIASIFNQANKALNKDEKDFIWLRDQFGATALVNNLKYSSYYRDLVISMKAPELLNEIESLNKYQKL